MELYSKTFVNQWLLLGRYFFEPWLELCAFIQHLTSLMQVDLSNRLKFILPKSFHFAAPDNYFVSYSPIISGVLTTANFYECMG
jgi:hypothetical protein